MKKIILFFALFFLCSPCFSQNWEIKDGINFLKTNRENLALDFFKSYVKANPNDSRGFYYLGLIYKNRNDFQSSRYYFNQAYLLDNNIVDIVVAPEVHDLPIGDYLDISDMYAESGKYKDAITYLDLILNLNPDFALAHYKKAEILLKMGENPRAKQAFLHAVELDNSYLNSEVAQVLLIKEVPKFNDNFYNAKGLRYFYSGNLARACDNFQIAIKQNYKNHEAQNNLARTYIYLDDFKSAKKHLKRAIILNKRYSAPYINYARISNDKTAKRVLEWALKFNTSDKNVYYELAKLNEKEQKFNDAFKNYKYALSISPRFIEAQIGAASTSILLNNSENAILYTRNAITLDTNNPDIYYLLAKLSFLDKNETDAKNYLFKALEIAKNPNYFYELASISKENEAKKVYFKNALLLEMTFDGKSVSEEFLRAFNK